VASAGAVLLGAGMVSSAVNGEDLAFFPVVATVANALWFLGSVALAVSLWRAGRVPRPIAGLFVLVMPCTIFLSQMGGGILAGAYLASLGLLLVRGGLEARRA
jgi:membrane-bound ClpP family serine protease